MEPDEGYVYVITLLRIYETGGAIGDDDKVIARRSGLSAKRATAAMARLFAKGKLVKSGTLYTNPVAELEIADGLARKKSVSKLNSERAKKGWQKTKEKQESDDAAGISRHPSGMPPAAHLHLHLKKDAAEAALPSFNEGPLSSPEKELFEKGKTVLGRASGGLIRNLLKAKAGNVALARAAIEQASTKHDPREYIGRIVRGASEETKRIGVQI
jgi:uncharacterized protein YdaU (DUF1376 family)